MKEGKSSLWFKLRNKYRLVVLDDETFEEKASFRLTRFNVYFFISTVFVLTVAGIFTLIVFTPLKEYIPGYGDMNQRKDYIMLELRTDSLSTIVEQQAAWINNIRGILRGEVDSIAENIVLEPVKFENIDLDKVAPEDLQLREEIEKEISYSLTFSDQQKKGAVALSQLNFFPPIKGYVTAGFNPREDHYGVDVVAPQNEPIKNILDGHVVLATWTLDGGYVIGIQHEYNLVSFYKHNSVLLKKVGNFVKAGDAIAMMGSSGELTSGPHLHFELWQDGAPINPEDFIVF